ncbi:hypothetical protein PHMEG_0002504 [Phytophthora megakarya]|uniref:Uncharacterized protein n=1 Tax=Phytophthora megakarya TaxID=4795 RepID=A0A225X0H4_9STRA|nr:hypothetical protein PHMEG_0002504 [Phytophthora megakarya]
MPRALCGDQRVGVEAHLKEWETISRIFPDLDVKLTHLEEGPGGEMIVTTKAFLTFTEDTFCYAFPHLVSDYRKNIIFAKLVGRRLEIPGTGRFVWDQMMGRVTLLSFDVDFIQPISHVLGSLEYVAIMFNHALIQLDGHPVVGF